MRAPAAVHDEGAAAAAAWGLDGALRPPPPLAAEAEETDGRTMQLFPTRAGTSQPPSQQQ